MRAHRFRNAALLALAIAGAWLWSRGPRREAAAVARSAAPAPPRRLAPHAPAVDDGATTPPPERTAFIADVIVSKDVVCPGEPFVLTVAAHDPGGADEGLYYVVGGGSFGNPVVLSYARPGEQEIPVTVFSKRGPGQIDTTTATVRVRDDCAVDAARVDLEQHVLGRHVVGFAATVRARTAVDPVASYRWDFGDGTSQETTAPFVEHDYRRTRPRRGIQPNLIVRVAARSASGRVLEGAAAVPFFNLDQKNKLEAGVVTPDAEVEAVQRGPDGITARAVVANPEDVALELDEVSAQAIPCAADAEAASTQHTAAAALGARTLPPGESRVSARLPASAIPPGACRVVLTVSGRAPSGEAVMFQLPLVLDEPAPTRVLDETSVDPDQQRELARIVAARRLLARTGPHDLVTQEEIDWLVRQGRIE